MIRADKSKETLKQSQSLIRNKHFSKRESIALEILKVLLLDMNSKEAVKESIKVADLFIKTLD